DKGGNPELIKESQRKRGASVELVDQVISLYDEWRTVRYDLDQVKKQQNALQKQIAQKIKDKADASELIKEKESLNSEKERLTTLEKEKEEILKSKASTIGNIVHKSVPVSLDEENNEIIRKWDPPTNENGLDIKSVKKNGILSHHEVLYRIDGYDSERGTNIAGHRGYFLTNDGVDLNMALIQYGLSFLRKHGYKKLQTPFFMRREYMAKTAQLEQFDEELYK
ncbi:5830_t:CDS:2, partial [Racocetra persica]